MAYASRVLSCAAACGGGDRVSIDLLCLWPFPSLPMREEDNESCLLTSPARLPLELTLSALFSLPSFTGLGSVPKMGLTALPGLINPLAVRLCLVLGLTVPEGLVELPTWDLSLLCSSGVRTLPLPIDGADMV